MWDNYASRKKKRYLEQIFNFALGMLKSLAHADLSGMSYKIDLYIYIHIYIYSYIYTYIFFKGRRGLRFHIGEGLLNVTARTPVFANHPPPSPQTCTLWRPEILSLGRILAIPGPRNLPGVLRDRWSE